MRSGVGLHVGLFVLVLLVGAALAAPLVTEHRPEVLDTSLTLAPPSVDHPFGTDSLGRDVFSRVLHGARHSLAAGGSATLIACLLGAGLGALAGTRGAVADGLLSRSADVVYAFPYLVGAIAILGLFAAQLEDLPQSLRVGVVVGVFSWPPLFRFVRAEMQRLASSDLAASARASGASPARTTFVHLLPAALGAALVPATFLAAGAILAEAGLGYLGLGIRAPEPSWGNILREAREYVRSAWWLAAYPGLFLYATTLALHLVGEGLRRRFQPGAHR